MSPLDQRGRGCFGLALTQRRPAMDNDRGQDESRVRDGDHNDDPDRQEQRDDRGEQRSDKRECDLCRHEVLDLDTEPTRP